APGDGLVAALVIVDTALTIDSVIETQGDLGEGIFQGGIIAFAVKEPGGLVTGQVTDAAGPKRGIAVASDDETYPLVALTGATGEYTAVVKEGAFTMTALDPFLGTSGSVKRLV
ncbi:MAG: hypothetical protein ACREGD_05225, partial [Candidatus Saccharimonadales bacterium]